MGEANEAQIEVEGIACEALLDTGATISTVSERFYREALSSLELHQINDIIKIECASGQLLPYMGYVEATVYVPGLTGKEGQETIFLVTPDTDYNSRIPVLLGTNILKPIMEGCKKEAGPLFLQRIALSTPWWLAFRCISVQERAVLRSNGKVGVVKCATAETIMIPSNKSITVPGFITDVISSDCLAMVHPAEKTVLAEGVEVTMVDLRDCKGTCLVEIANTTKRPVIIPPRALLCELQHVDMVNQDQEKQTKMTTEEEKAFLEKLKFEDTDLTPEQAAQARDLLLSYRDIFSMDDFDIGHTAKIKHRINLTDNTPFKQRHRRIPPSMYEEVKSHLRNLLDNGIITESDSPWASGIVLVQKKDGRLRFCIDYRQLNQRTVKDAYALPRFEEMMDQLIGSKYFSSLDMRSGYYQVEIEEEDKPKTAFTVGPLGFYQCERMPFGLTNAPATFQRLMERCMGELHMKENVTFIDDVIVHGCTFDEELTRLGHAFEKIRSSNLKLNPAKCSFFKRRVCYCGHVVSEDGIETDPAKTEKIAEWPAPTNVDEVREFVGLCGYYRRFVKGFAKIAKPLTDLLGGPGKKTKGRRRKIMTEPVPWQWGEEQDGAFSTLKERLTSPPVLAYADYSRPFTLYTDATMRGCVMPDTGRRIGTTNSLRQPDSLQGITLYTSLNSLP